MQQFLSLLKKEFISYFKSPMAYFVLFIYLFVTAGSAFYFGGFLSMHDSSVYALFSTQPIILMIVVPAITMKLWADEYRLGTAEFLLTQPLPFFKPVGAKFLFAWLFCLLLSLGLLPFVFYTSLWLKIDWGSVVSGFCGLWLVMALFCSLGCMVSAFNRNLVVSYLTGTFVLALWVALPLSYLFYTYNNFLFAEIGFSDLFYFLSFTGICLWINLLAISFKISAKKHKNMYFSAFCLVIFGATCLFNFATNKLFSAKLDLTSENLYSLKSQSIEVVNKAEKALSIDVYVAKDLVEHNSDYFHYLQQVQRFLNKYQVQSDGLIEVNVIYVEPYSKMEDKIIKSGLFYNENSRGTRDYFGAIIRDGNGNEEVIKQFLIERKLFLEKDVDVALLKLLEPNRKKLLAVYMDPQQNLESFEGALLSLENDYRVENASSRIYEFSTNVDLVVLINPKKLSSYLMYAVDQYLMRGGKLVVFFDFYTQNQPEVVNEEDLSIVKFLDNWGVSLKPLMVDDGVFNKKFATTSLPLKLNKAVPFEVLNKDVKVKPLIESKDGLTGAIIEGNFLSLHQKNPFDGTRIENDTAEFLPQNVLPAQIALVSDVDILDDEFWLSPTSEDRNPYSTIENAGNVQALRAIIDYMCGNNEYLNFPLNDKFLNKDSIGKLIENKAVSKYADKLKELQHLIRYQRAVLVRDADGDWDKINEMLQVSKAGLQIAQSENDLQNLEYQIKNDYSRIVQNMALWLVFFIPLLLISLIYSILCVYKKIQLTKIKEIVRE